MLLVLGHCLRPLLRLAAALTVFGGQEAVILLADEGGALLQLIKAGPADGDQPILAQHEHRGFQGQAVGLPAPAGQLLLRGPYIAQNLRNFTLHGAQLLEDFPGQLPAQAPERGGGGVGGHVDSPFRGKGTLRKWAEAIFSTSSGLRPPSPQGEGFLRFP